MFKGISLRWYGERHTMLSHFLSSINKTHYYRRFFCDSVSALVCGTVNCWVLGAVPRPQQYARPVY